MLGGPQADGHCHTDLVAVGAQAAVVAIEAVQHARNESIVDRRASGLSCGFQLVERTVSVLNTGVLKRAVIRLLSGRGVGLTTLASDEVVRTAPRAAPTRSRKKPAVERMVARPKRTLVLESSDTQRVTDRPAALMPDVAETSDGDCASSAL